MFNGNQASVTQTAAHAQPTQDDLLKASALDFLKARMLETNERQILVLVASWLQDDDDFTMWLYQYLWDNKEVLELEFFDRKSNRYIPALDVWKNYDKQGRSKTLRGVFLLSYEDWLDQQRRGLQEHLEQKHPEIAKDIIENFDISTLPRAFNARHITRFLLEMKRDLTATWEEWEKKSKAIVPKRMLHLTKKSTSYNKHCSFEELTDAERIARWDEWKNKFKVLYLKYIAHLIKKSTLDQLACGLEVLTDWFAYCDDQNIQLNEDFWNLFTNDCVEDFPEIIPVIQDRIQIFFYERILEILKSDLLIDNTDLNTLLASYLDNGEKYNGWLNDKLGKIPGYLQSFQIADSLKQLIDLNDLPAPFTLNDIQAFLLSVMQQSPYKFEQYLQQLKDKKIGNHLPWSRECLFLFETNNGDLKIVLDWIGVHNSPLFNDVFMHKELNKVHVFIPNVGMETLEIPQPYDRTLLWWNIAEVQLKFLYSHPRLMTKLCSKETLFYLIKYVVNNLIEHTNSTAIASVVVDMCFTFIETFLQALKQNPEKTLCQYDDLVEAMGLLERLGVLKENSRILEEKYLLTPDPKRAASVNKVLSSLRFFTFEQVPVHNQPNLIHTFLVEHRARIEMLLFDQVKSPSLKNTVNSMFRWDRLFKFLNVEYYQNNPKHEINPLLQIAFKYPYSLYQNFWDLLYGKVKVPNNTTIGINRDFVIQFLTYDFKKQMLVGGNRPEYNIASYINRDLTRYFTSTRNCLPSYCLDDNAKIKVIAVILAHLSEKNRCMQFKKDLLSTTEDTSAACKDLLKCLVDYFPDTFYKRWCSSEPILERAISLLNTCVSSGPATMFLKDQNAIINRQIRNIITNFEDKKITSFDKLIRELNNLKINKIPAFVKRGKSSDLEKAVQFLQAQYECLFDFELAPKPNQTNQTNEATQCLIQ